MNTAINYIYRDAANYKLWRREIVAGEIPEGALFGDDVPFDAEYFYPAQVGFNDDTFASTGWQAYDDDPVNHEIVFVEPTDEAPTVGITAEAFLEACRKGACDGRVIL